MGRIAARLTLVGLSLGGLLGAHWLAFVFAAPHVHARSELLAQTGHGSWLPFAVAVVTSLALAFLRGSGRGWSELALLQLVGFLALEGVERIGAHEGIGHLLQEPVLYLGLSLQLIVSLLATLLLRVAREVARLLGWNAALHGGRAAGPPHTYVSRIPHLTGLATEAWNLRGPPSVPALS